MFFVGCYFRCLTFSVWAKGAYKFKDARDTHYILCICFMSTLV